MSVNAKALIDALSPPLPTTILQHLVTEYQEIKRQFALGRYDASELDGGRFGECVLRLLQHLNGIPVTPFGQHISNRKEIANRTGKNTSLPSGISTFVPQVVGVLMDVRNQRDVAHVGGEVSPNYSDSLFVSHCADWIMTEIVRTFYKCSIDEARKIVGSLNELQIPVVAEVDDFIRVQSTDLKASDKVLVILYHLMPERANSDDLGKWIRYSPKNMGRFKSGILKKLDDEALIHYEGGLCVLLPKGVAYVDKHIPLELRV